MVTTIAEIAAWGGMTGRGNNFGPCPVCDEKTTSGSDKRPPIRVKGDDQWLCMASAHTGEPKGGGPVMLARALHARGDITDEQLERVKQARNADEQRPDSAAAEAGGGFDVAGGWAALVAEVGTWRDRVRQWAIERGLGGEIAAALETTAEVAAVPRGRWPASCAAFIEGVAWHPRDLLIAVRRPDGVVVDIERRWSRGTGKPEQGPKTARLAAAADPEHPTRGYTGTLTGALMFGRLERAVMLAEQGEPIVIVEGSADYLTAEGACRVRGEGAVLGALGAGGLVPLAEALVRALRASKAGVEPQHIKVVIVPHVGDVLDRPRHRDHRIGEINAWNAAVTLLDDARVSICAPAVERGDLCDAVSGSVDPVAAVWRVLAGGRPVLSTGRRIAMPERELYVDPKVLDRWKGATDRELRAAAYRLPLADYIHCLHYRMAGGQDGSEPYLRYERRIPEAGMKSGERRLDEAVLHWLSVHGIHLTRDDDGGQWVWDPLEPAVPPIERDVRRVIPLRVEVGGDVWGGWLQQIGWLNTASGDGKQVDRCIKDAALRAQRVPSRSWLTSWDDDDVAVGLHLHTRAEDVLIVEPERVRTVRNGTDGRVLEAEASAPAIEWVSGLTYEAGCSLLWRMLGATLAAEHPLRAMMVAWALLAPVRERLTARPILFGTGSAGSGKSQLAKQLSAFFYGAPDPDDVTPAGAWDLARQRPALLLDNIEPRHFDALESFVLKVTTRSKRQVRDTNKRRGTIAQVAQAMVHINAIGPPRLAEHLRRMLLVQFDRAHRMPGFVESAHLDAIVANRSHLWSAVMRLYADHVLPALSAGEHRRWAERVPEDHPVEGFREALGYMAVIGEGLGRGELAWGRGHLGTWLDRTRMEIAESRVVNDPLKTALDELRFQWNRVVEGPYGRSRPAFAEGLFVCRPLFVFRGGATDPVESDLFKASVPRLTTDVADGMWLAGRHGCAEVVGFEGNYADLYRDLRVATRDARSFLDAVPTARDVGYNIGNVDGWATRCVGRPRRAGERVYLYRWLCVPAAGEVAQEPASAGEVAPAEPKGFRPVKKQLAWGNA